jgi:OOP family OmpA-OmpF porin
MAFISKTEGTNAAFLLVERRWRGLSRFAESNHRGNCKRIHEQLTIQPREDIMVRKLRKWKIAGILLALATLFGSVTVQAAACAPKVDNFILFVDQSGSMYMEYEKAKVKKMAVAKQILADMNAMIPDLGYGGTLDLFAPFEELQAPVVYNRPAFAAAIQKLKDQQKIFGRQTPMAKGILSAEEAAVLSGMKGRTAVIMLSDGKSNVGGDPVQAAKETADAHPNAVFYVISLAQPDAKGKKGSNDSEIRGAEINREIAQIGGGMLVEASSLYKNQAAMQKFVMEVFCAPPPVEQKIVLRGIQFDLDKYNIKPEYQPLLDEAVSSLKSKPNVKVVIGGHTDNSGTADYNMKLSEKRAEAVLDYFVSKGISASRLEAVGHGFDDPIANNKTAEGRALNRRVELKVIQ